MIPALVVLLALQGAAPPPSAPATSSATTRLGDLRAIFAELECDRIIEQAPFVFEHRLATPAERHEAGFMHAYCAVVVGNLGAAEALFSTIVAEDVAAEPPFPIEPRVRVLLEAARTEAQKKLDAAAAAARAEAIGTIAFKVTPPTGLKGGARAFFAIELEDPRHLVKGLRLEFRRADDMGFYALPVTKLPDGTWRGEIPGTYTRSANGQTIEWFISAVDAEAGMLTSWGSRTAPHTLQISPGSSLATDMRANERLTPELRLSLAALATPLLTSAGTLAGAALVVATSWTNSAFLTYLAAATMPSIGAVLGTSVVAAAILDPTDATVAIFTTALFAGVASALIFTAGIDSAVNTVGGSVAADAILLSVGVAVLGVGASAVTPTALVLIDSPGE